MTKQESKTNFRMYMPKEKCYNSGKITGVSSCKVFDKFHGADFAISALNYRPVNPLYNGLSCKSPWIMHMVVDVFNLLRCPAVYFQNDWQDSRGARIEHRIARLMGKTIIYQEEAA